MSKLTKFFRDPVMFFRDAASNRRATTRTGVPTYVVGFSTWKQYMRKYFSDRNLMFLPRDISEQEFNHVWKRKILSDKSSEIFIWGFKAPVYLLDFAKKSNVKVVFVEDGFIRSINLGATKAPPMSLCLDTRTPYFNSQTASDLEVLLNEYDFSANAALLDRADKAIQLLLNSGVSKYNDASAVDIEKIYGPKTGKRILVIGQVEDDASIKFGCETAITNNDLVRMAAQENPGAQIIFKPHPDVLAGHRGGYSNPGDVANICHILKDKIPLAQAFETIDHVYTITSLAGFEALLRGIKVTTVGAPFYSGWGLTDDRQATSRRVRKLNINELFAGAYLLYPQYFEPETGERRELEYIISKIQSESNRTFLQARRPSSQVSVELVKRANNKAAKASKNGTEPSMSADNRTSHALDWFRSSIGAELQGQLDGLKPVCLYLPGISQEQDDLISEIKCDQKYALVPFDMIKQTESGRIGEVVRVFAAQNPQQYRKMLMSRLIPIRKQVKAFVFTCDSLPLARAISSVCEELNIPRILVPNTSVSIDKNTFYRDAITSASMPTADLVLVSGAYQRDIFLERGYPDERLVAVGTPKFDFCKTFVPDLSHAQYCRLHGLAQDKKIMVFACQNFDGEADGATISATQNKVITDLLDFSHKNDLQLVIRLPEAGNHEFGPELSERLKSTNSAVLSGVAFHVVSPEEEISHADLVVSVNDINLLKAVLLKKCAVAIKYHNFDSVWRKAGIPTVHTPDELPTLLNEMLSSGWLVSEEGMNWAAQNFANGEFDGKAAERIQQKIADVVEGRVAIRPYKSTVDRILNGEKVDVVASHIVGKATETTAIYVRQMIGARSLVKSSDVGAGLATIAAADVFLEWGIKPTEGKAQQRKLAKSLGRPVLTIEDGFIRSVDIGLSGEAGLSIIIDDTTAYYDATQPSRLQRLLEHGPELTPDQIDRSQNAIRKIVSNRVSKYNHALDIPLKIGTPGRRKILLVDQRFGDQSVESGLANERSYERMLHDVVRHRSDCDIIVKQHPDAIRGGKSSYFSNERLSFFTENLDNIYPIRFDVNPFSLFDIVDEVYAVTSGMGFEALMAGKTVHCYGAPFYAGWGATIDQINIPGRSRRRDVNELFYYAYIESSRYFHPDRDEVVEVEDLVDYIVEKRGWQ